MPLTWFLLLGILACGGRDRDGDGYEEAHGDCDDSDASVHPGADEFCDGIDTDCDGTLDGSDALDPTVWYLDLDGDGYGDEGDVGERACDAPAGRVSDHTDCEDQDSSIHPDTEDLCDEVDTDCDGAVDDDEAQDWYLDADQDGWGDSDQSVSACDPPALYVDQGGDCDDERSSVNPDAEEVWYDGRDEDCDGEDDYDADADGFISSLHGGEDCQDALDEVHPSATEICGDGLDNDCDGTGNACSPFGARSLEDLGTRFLSSYLVNEAGIELGSSVAGDGDLNGDGLMDVVVGGMGPSTAAGTPGAYVAPEDGYVLVFYGPVTGEELTEADSDADLTDLRCGIWLAMAGDVDADGFDDLAVGCKQGGAGHLYLLSGPIEGTVAIEDEFTASLDGASGTVAVIMEAAGDVDGDGFADLLVSAPLESTGGTDAGAVYLLQGPVTGEFTLETDQVHAKLVGAEGQAIEMVGGEGDVDGDGLGDFLAAGTEAESRGSGRVYLVAGSDLSDPGEFILEDVARAELVGEVVGDAVGSSVAIPGDIDDDGLDDVLVGAENGRDGHGAAFLLLGPVSGGIELSEADAILEGEARSDSAGCSVDGAGDVDGDGNADLLVGARAADVQSSGSAAGKAYVWYGPVSGTWSLGDANVVLQGEQRTAYTGTALSRAGDTDGDGFSDILVGAPGFDSDEVEDAGAAYLVLGGAH